MKMIQKLVQTLLLLIFFKSILCRDIKMYEDGSRVPIVCAPTQTGRVIIWFRVRNGAGMQYIASYTTSGLNKGERKSADIPDLNDESMEKNTLSIQKFDKERDSGAYSCASFKDNVLYFGDVTRLAGLDAPKETTSSPSVTTEADVSTTIQSCVCNSHKCKTVTKPKEVCDPRKWGPLASGCGLLFLLLIITIFYCNRIRTKRCPHHYKRQMVAAKT